MGGRREEGSGWGTHVYLWRIHFDIWQNQYNIVKFKKKTKTKKKTTELPYDFAISLLSIYPKISLIRIDTWTPIFTAGLFTIAKTWTHYKCPSTDEWIKKTLYIYTISHNKEGNHAICSNMDGPRDYHTK